MSSQDNETQPKYFALATALRTQIQSGQFASGDKITSEPALCAQHQLSRGTVRQAIQLLVDEGLLVRHQGRGTFVAQVTPRSQHFSLSSFADEMRRQHRRPRTVLLKNETLPANAATAARLQIAPQTPVLLIQRLRLADDQPVAIETRYLAQALCPDLQSEDLENNSLHWLLVQKYEIPLVRMEHVVEIETVSQDAATHLSLPADAKAFHIDRLTFTTTPAGEKIPAVWFQAVYTQDNYQIQTATL